MSLDPVVKAPFPWFGGKSRTAHLIWERFGDVRNYVEPFFGSGAVLLGRPHPPRIETVNDKDGFVCNAWRAISDAPEETAEYADWPVNENDLHARHAWLTSRRDQLSARLEGDPEYYDTRIAGWWLWGISCWIGGSFCNTKGPWEVVDGKLVKIGNRGKGVKRQRVHIGGAGQGVHRKRVHLGRRKGVKRQLVHLGDAGQGVNRKRVHLGDAGQGVNRPRISLQQYFETLQKRMRNVRVCCGDWLRVLGPTPTLAQGLTAVFLDPPYSRSVGRDEDIYAVENLEVASTVRDWAIEHGHEPLFRIAVCGYEGEHDFPPDWTCVAWKAHGGYGGGANGNNVRERIWFSPHCIRKSEQADWVRSFAEAEKGVFAPS